MTKTVTTRTRAEVYKLWLAALRSGKYRQATDALRKTRKGHNSFCCLGVLCDLARKDGGPNWVIQPQNDHNEGDNATFLHCTGDLPENVREFMGITHGQQEGLIDLNDQDKARFGTIADHIECVIMPEACK